MHCKQQCKKNVLFTPSLVLASLFHLNIVCMDVYIKYMSIYILEYLYKQRSTWDHSRFPNYKSATTLQCGYWLQSNRKKKKKVCWIFISFKALKISLSLKKGVCGGGKVTIEFSKKFTQLFNQQNDTALFFYGFLVMKK